MRMVVAGEGADPECIQRRFDFAFQRSDFRPQRATPRPLSAPLALPPGLPLPRSPCSASVCGNSSSTLPTVLSRNGSAATEHAPVNDSASRRVFGMLLREGLPPGRTVLTRSARDANFDASRIIVRKMRAARDCPPCPDAVLSMHARPRPCKVLAAVRFERSTTGRAGSGVGWIPVGCPPGD